ncbi:MAG: hypothetical protein U9N32_01595 [Spirochaetota bacterium]|nr:hypothetical protein [Spirochaetota bacterium]
MTKKIILIALFLAVLLFPVTVVADMGIGGIAGYSQPTGLSFKVNNFPVVSIGWSLDGNWISGTVDYWFINKKIERNVLWYLGAGAKMTVGNPIGLTFRVPIGIQWYFMPAFELFGELAPGFAILPKSDFDFSGGIGLRYHF